MWSRKRVVAAIAGAWLAVVVLFGIGLHLAARHAVARDKAALGPLVGRTWRKLSLRADDGRRFAVADGRHWTVVLFASARWDERVQTDLDQLAGALKGTNVVFVPATDRRPVAPSRGAALVSTRYAGKLRAAAERVRQHPPLDGESWTINPQGTVVGYVHGEPNLAEAAWPVLAPAEQAAEQGFKPTPLAELSPDGANRRWRQRKLAVWRTWLGDAWQQYGRHDAKWDALVPEFLENCARQAANSPDCPSLLTMLNQAHKLVDLGCDDPLVLHHAARVACHVGGRLYTGEWSAKAAVLLPATRYPARVSFYIPFAAPGTMTLTEGTDEYKAAVQRVMEACTGSFADGEREVIVDELLRWRLVEDRLRAIRSMDAFSTPPVERCVWPAGTDLWLRLYVGGSTAARLAEEQMSTAKRAAVQTGPRTLSGKDIELARHQWTLAAHLLPDHAAPAAALTMLSAAEHRGGECRRWAERAFAADANDVAVLRCLPQAMLLFDYVDREGILAVGHEAADVRLADTLAPLGAVEAQLASYTRTEHAAYVSDGGPDYSARGGPGMMWMDLQDTDRVLACLERAAAAAPEPAEAARLRTVGWIILQRAWRMDAARALAAQLGAALDPAYAAGREPSLDGWMWDWPTQLDGQSPYFSAPQAGALMAPDGQPPVGSAIPDEEQEGQDGDATRARRPRQAAAVESLQGTAAVPPTVLTLDEQLAAFDAKLPDEPARPRVADGLAWFAGREGSLLRCTAALPPQFQVSAEIHLTGSRHDYARLRLELERGKPAATIDVQDSGTVTSSVGGRAIAEPGQWHVLAIRLYKARLSYLVDGKPVLLATGEYDVPAPPGPYHWTVSGDGQAVAMRNLAIRDLSKTP